MTRVGDDCGNSVRVTDPDRAFDEAALLFVIHFVVFARNTEEGERLCAALDEFGTAGFVFLTVNFAVCVVDGGGNGTDAFDFHDSVSFCYGDVFRETGIPKQNFVCCELFRRTDPEIDVFKMDIFDFVLFIESLHEAR